MKVVISGASGFLGTAWRDHLAREGHEVVRLVRGEALTPNESHWDPYAGEVDRDVIEDADVVATLSGAPLAHWPWTERYRATFTASRVETTRTLAEAIAASDRKPAFVAQNGIAGYGDQGDRVLTEEARNDADTFMAGVTRAWQAATSPAAAAGARVVVMRSGVVLDRRAARSRCCSRSSSWRSVARWDRATSTSPPSRCWTGSRRGHWLATRDTSSGVYNLSAPNPTTNAEFSHRLAQMLHRPAVEPVPAFALNTLAGTVSSELLNSTRVEPARLLAEGFSFDHPTLEERLAAALA